MFTGIVEEVGEVVEKEDLGAGTFLYFLQHWLHRREERNGADDRAPVQDRDRGPQDRIPVSQAANPDFVAAALQHAGKDADIDDRPSGEARDRRMHDGSGGVRHLDMGDGRRGREAAEAHGH